MGRCSFGKAGIGHAGIGNAGISHAGFTLEGVESPIGFEPRTSCLRAEQRPSDRVHY